MAVCRAAMSYSTLKFIFYFIENIDKGRCIGSAGPQFFCLFWQEKESGERL